MSQWPFPSQPKTIAPQAEAILVGESHTPEQLELAIKAQGDLVEWLALRGKNAAARQAFATVKLQHAKRTPEAVAAMERVRGLQ